MSFFACPVWHCNNQYYCLKAKKTQQIDFHKWIITVFVILVHLTVIVHSIFSIYFFYLKVITVRTDGAGTGKTKDRETQIKVSRSV